ncbi:hypothetical protein T4A_11964 [Trichinella pseudospiralis]|uniref:Uncharacterized protein n=1 Tax=Trichinella pseudospiralis TaxID=6337 RepID=A0A0V1EF13_TRIPS|nr:hypothetical protein T4A_11964 [Trichinella pseudospiralis]
MPTNAKANFDLKALLIYVILCKNEKYAKKTKRSRNDHTMNNSFSQACRQLTGTFPGISSTDMCIYIAVG